MLSRDELLELLRDVESSRVERTVSTNNMDKFCEAVCAFANDMPGSKRNGYLLVGVHDDGSLCGFKATDVLLTNLASIRSDGNVLPIPSMSVETFHFDAGDVVVVEVAPAVLPPVRYRGRTWIRVGPRKAIATPEEEEVLVERRRARFPTFDSMPCVQAKLDDLDLDLFRHGFLPKAFDEGTLAGETRSIERQLEALCFFSTEYGCPTNAGIILFGKNPLRFLPGDYIQFVQFAGKDRSAPIVNQQMFRGNLLEVLPAVDTFVKTAIARNRPVPVTVLRERNIWDYPKWPVRELVMNAVMHRDYRSTGPTMFYQYSDRIELLNSGGLYGRVNRDNFPDENDYRNPVIADTMRTLGYVNRFGRGIGRVRTELAENGNGDPLFDTGQIGSFRVTVWLTRYAGTSVQGDGERSQNEGKVNDNTLESSQTGAESSQGDEERSQSEEQTRHWAEGALPTGIRSDARRNMCSILCLVGKDGAMTADSIAAELGMTRRGVQKIMASLQKLGLLKREGGDYGGRWIVCRETEGRNQYPQ